MSILCFCLLSVLVSPGVLGLSVGSRVKKCAQRGTQLESCIKEGLNSIMLTLATGWLEDKKGIDPLFLTEVKEDYSDGNITLSLALRDVVVVGLASTIVQNVKSKSLEEGKLELMCKTSSVSTRGVYQSEGYLIRFPLHSQGNFNITLSDITSLVIVHLTRFGDYLQINELKLSVMPSKIDVQAGQKLDGDNTLGETLNIYLNENSFELFDLLRPKLLSYFSALIKDLANTILMQTPEDSIFPNPLL